MIERFPADLLTFAEHVEDEYGLTEPDAETLVRLLCAIRDCRADLAAFARRVEQDLLAVAGQKRFVVEDLGEVEIRRLVKRTGWRHDELVPVVVALIMDEHGTLYDEETGELLPYSQIGINVADRLRQCVGFGAGKVTGLRALGIQPDEFCVETAEGWSVQLPPRKVT